jgi:excisionase family DNA binding protein
MVSADLLTLLADPERADALSPDQLAELIGQAAALQAKLWARLQLTRPAVVATSSSTAAPEPDRLLSAEEAAERLGVGKRWMYRHAGELPFTRRLTGGTLRFSSRGLERWKEARR